MRNDAVSIFWFRRDLRIHDNHALFQALRSGSPVLPIFIFDSRILSQLSDREDARLTFIHDRLELLRSQLKAAGSDLLVLRGEPLSGFQALLSRFSVRGLYANEDYEPYARERDRSVADLLQAAQIPFHSLKDQVIFAKDEILTHSGSPYTVFSPYFRKWLSSLSAKFLAPFASETQLAALYRPRESFESVSLESLGFLRSTRRFPVNRLDESRLGLLVKYEQLRDRPDLDATSHLGVHLRFGTVSVREVASMARELNQTWLTQLAWRDFFHQILFHYPRVVDRCFKSKFERIPWSKDPELFRAWCEGRTGIPIVDAGMRELNQTGFMHNRVRMIAASFLCKQMRIDWRKGERYFAEKLLDYDLALNNGNWQWCAGTGCDAVPYFRIFNPLTQALKFDPLGEYQTRWVPERFSASYPAPIVAHEEGRRLYLSLLQQEFEGECEAQEASFETSAVSSSPAMTRVRSSF